VKLFLKAYIDDTLIFSKVLEDHLTHLHYVFSILTFNNVTLNPKKSFISFPNIKLLRQYVDSLGFTTYNEKLKAITSLSFPATTATLKTYLGITSYLRNYVQAYGKVVKPLL